MKVINLFGGPGFGKSTLAAGIFYNLKIRGYKAELVTEFVKDAVYEENYVVKDHQLTLLGEQDRRLHRLRNHVDFVITDSPLLLGCVYSDIPYIKAASKGAFDTYDNMNFFLYVTLTNYQQYGRIETKEESLYIHDKIYNMLNYYGYEFKNVTSGHNHLDYVLSCII